MATPTHARRAALRETLIAIAEARMEQSGPEALRARDLANDASCAVGAIYNAVKDMGELVHAVNVRTFTKLRATLSDCIDADPTEELTNLAKAYHRFAQHYPNLWAALFANLDPTYTEWYRAAFDELESIFERPIGRLSPHLDAQKRSQLSRAAVSSVHGIVLLNRDETFSGMPPGQIDRMLVMTVKQIASK